MNTMNRGRNSSKGPATMTSLPDELILEILTWLPGRELGRSKCVCKLWKSLIGSPPFLPLYRRRNPCLMVHWSDGGRHYFHSSLLRRHRTDLGDETQLVSSEICSGETVDGDFRLKAASVWSEGGRLEDFRLLRSFPAGDRMTQLVNGVICSGELVPDLQLKVINVCTGQALPVPKPLPHDRETFPSFHLGYDPKTRRYKLLRLLFPSDEQLPRQMKAEIVTLGPTGTVWEWRKLDDESAGIQRLPPNPYLTVTYSGVSMFPGDGFLCWIFTLPFHTPDFGVGMVLFDMDKEVFRWVKLPGDAGVEVPGRMLVPRVLLEDNCLVIYLWVLPAPGGNLKCECYRLEEKEGNVWRKCSLQLEATLSEESYWLGAVSGSPISLSESSIMLMNSHSMFVESSGDVYCCINGTGLWRFWVGKLPRIYYQGKLNNFAKEGFPGRVSCLLDSNVLYLSLEDVLNGNGLV